MLQHNVLILGNITLFIGRILRKSQQRYLFSPNTRFCTLSQVFNEETNWILLNWRLIESTNNRVQNINVALPQELVRTDLVQWIHVSFVLDVAFIFHISHLLGGSNYTLMA